MTERLLPGWPALMTSRTLASYLDCIQPDGRLRPKFSWWLKQPGFPEPHDGSGVYYRAAVDQFLASHFGFADPIEASRRELDRMFG